MAYIFYTSIVKVGNNINKLILHGSGLTKILYNCVPCK